MPPIKTYKFEHLYDKTIRFEIDADSFTSAMEKMVETTKHPADYVCINI